MTREPFNYAKATPAEIGKRHEKYVKDYFERLKKSCSQAYSGGYGEWFWMADWVRQEVRRAIRQDRKARKK